METNNQTMSVEQFVMILTAQSIISAEYAGAEDPYNCCAIRRIYCNDGYDISVQAHAGVHCSFRDVERDYLGYSKTFGSKLLRCETDSVELNQYCSDSIEDIEECVERHGGIDFQTTMEHAIQAAQRVIENSRRF